MQSAENYDDNELDLFLERARHYPLLTAQEEVDADQGKWQAVSHMLDILVTDRTACGWWQQLAWACRQQAPVVGNFDNRDEHFLLRRELGDYLGSGEGAQRMATLEQAEANNSADLRQYLEDLALPASLVTGSVRLLLRDSGKPCPCPVADALSSWRKQWPQQSYRQPRALKAGVIQRLRKELRHYEQSRDILTLHNLRLVFSIAARYREKGVPLPDLLQEGTLGLMRAVEKYDHRRGYRFSTYAFNWITQAVRRYLSERGSLVRFPSQVNAQIARLHRERLTWIDHQGREPTVAELADLTGLSQDKVLEIRSLGNFTASLDTPVNDDEDRTLGDRLSDDQQAGAAALSENDSLRRFLLEQIAGLEPNEKQVIVDRWGLEQARPLSRAELADKMCISREWVRQLEVSALDKLRQSPALQAVFADEVEAPAFTALGG